MYSEFNALAFVDERLASALSPLHTNILSLDLQSWLDITGAAWESDATRSESEHRLTVLSPSGRPIIGTDAKSAIRTFKAGLHNRSAVIEIISPLPSAWRAGPPTPA
jgi:hypothetical protein